MSTGRDIAVTLTADSRGFGRGVKSARDDLSALTKTVAGMKSAFIGFLSISALKGFATGLAGIIGNIDDLSATADKLGVSTDFLSELQGAAKLSDTDVDSLNQGLLLMEKTLGKAGLRGEDTEETFLKIADSVAAMNDPMERAAYVTSIFGKSGQQLIGILSRGRAGIQELRREVKDLGGSISSDMAKQAGLADDAVKRLGIAWQGFARTLAIDVAPSITDMIGDFIELRKAMHGIDPGGIDTDTRSLWKEMQDNLAESMMVVEAPLHGMTAAEADALVRENRDILRNARKARTDAAGNRIPGEGFDFESSRQHIETKNPALSVTSKEGFSILARALRGPSQNIPQQQLAEQKKGNQKLDDIKNAIKDIKLPPVGDDF